MSVPKLFSRIEEIEKRIQNIDSEPLGFERIETKIPRNEKIRKIISESVRDLAPPDQIRVQSEFEGFGPLEKLIDGESVTEIICNSATDIWFEQDGQLHPLEDRFATKLTYRNFFESSSGFVENAVNRRKTGFVRTLSKFPPPDGRR